MGAHVSLLVLSRGGSNGHLSTSSNLPRPANLQQLKRSTALSSSTSLWHNSLITISIFCDFWKHFVNATTSVRFVAGNMGVTRAEHNGLCCKG